MDFDSSISSAALLSGKRERDGTNKADPSKKLKFGEDGTDAEDAVDNNENIMDDAEIMMDDTSNTTRMENNVGAIAGMEIEELLTNLSEFNENDEEDELFGNTISLPTVPVPAEELDIDRFPTLVSQQRQMWEDSLNSKSVDERDGRTVIVHKVWQYLENYFSKFFTTLSSSSSTVIDIPNNATAVSSSTSTTTTRDNNQPVPSLPSPLSTILPSEEDTFINALGQYLVDFYTSIVATTCGIPIADVISVFSTIILLCVSGIPIGSTTLLQVFNSQTNRFQSNSTNIQDTIVNRIQFLFNSIHLLRLQLPRASNFGQLREMMFVNGAKVDSMAIDTLQQFGSDPLSYYVIKNMTVALPLLQYYYTTLADYLRDGLEDGSEEDLPDGLPEDLQFNSFEEFMRKNSVQSEFKGNTSTMNTWSPNSENVTVRLFYDPCTDWLSLVPIPGYVPIMDREFELELLNNPQNEDIRNIIAVCDRVEISSALDYVNTVVVGIPHTNLITISSVNSGENDDEITFGDPVPLNVVNGYGNIGSRNVSNTITAPSGVITMVGTPYLNVYINDSLDCLIACIAHPSINHLLHYHPKVVQMEEEGYLYYIH